MKDGQRLPALVVVGLMAMAGSAFAQAPDRTAPPGSQQPAPKSNERPAPKSDEHRIVGKVVQIDRGGRVMKLATEEGVIRVELSADALQVFRVGDTISIPRSATESPSASPRQ